MGEMLENHLDSYIEEKVDDEFIRKYKIMSIIPILNTLVILITWISLIKDCLNPKK